MYLSVYESCLTSKVYGDVLDEEIFDFIKRNKKAELVRKQHGTSNYAKQKVKLPSLTWAGRFKETRSSNNLIEPSGYVYFDIDNYTDKDKIASIPEVKAVWLSLSGKGIGGIFRSDVNTETYTNTYKDFAKKYNLNLDKTSDVSRVNIITYDKDIIVKEKTEVFPTGRSTNRIYVIDKDVNNDHEEVCALSFNSAKLSGYEYVVGCRDNFCSYFFFMTNLYGCDLDYAVSYLFSKGLSDYSDFKIYEKAISVYSRNRDKFNTKKLNNLYGILRRNQERYS